MSTIVSVSGGCEMVASPEEELNKEEPRCSEIQQVQSTDRHSKEESLERLQQEERLIKATSPHMSLVNSYTSKEKIDIASKIAQGVISADVLPIIVETLAPHDSASAQSYADKITTDKESVLEIIETLKDLNKFTPSDLVETLRAEVMANSPLALETLEMFKNIRAGLRARLEVQKGYMTGGQRPLISYFAASCFEVWGGIFSIEAVHPFLFVTQFEKEFSSLLTDIEMYKKYNLDDGVYLKINDSLYHIIQSLKTNHPNKAQVILHAMTDDYKIFKGGVDLIKAQHANKEFAKEEILSNLIMQAQAEQNSLYKAADLVEIFNCLALNQDVEKAFPYLERAKSLAMDSDDYEKSTDILVNILRAEDDHQLPSAQETRNHLCQLFISYFTKKEEVATSLSKKVDCLVEMFLFIACIIKDGEKALPYLEKAKSLVADSDKNNDESAYALGTILDTEINPMLPDRLPSAQETLNNLYQVIKTADNISCDTIDVMIKAESAGGASFKDFKTIQL